MGRSTFQGPVRSLAGFYSQGSKTTLSLTAAAITLDVDGFAGRLIRVNNPNAIITLPAINATPDPKSSGPGGNPSSENNIGVPFTFLFETAAVAAKIIAQGLDRIVGSVIIQGTSLGGFSSVPATTTTLNFNGGTTGGAVGTMLTLQAIVANKWLLRDANLVGVGAPATPFS